MKMKELLEKLEKSYEELKLISELTEKYKDNKVVAEKLFYKKMEDGILTRLKYASLQQLLTMKNNFKFRYYSKDITDNLIDSQIIRNKRRDKLKKIETL